MDAGIPMHGLVCAVACAVQLNGEETIDPTLKQEQVGGVLYVNKSTNASQFVSFL
jgi:ribonuclease PH